MKWGEVYNMMCILFCFALIWYVTSPRCLLTMVVLKERAGIFIWSSDSLPYPHSSEQAPWETVQGQWTCVIEPEAGETYRGQIRRVLQGPRAGFSTLSLRVLGSHWKYAKGEWVQDEWACMCGMYRETDGERENGDEWWLLLSCVFWLLRESLGRREWVWKQHDALLLTDPGGLLPPSAQKLLELLVNQALNIPASEQVIHLG